MTLLAVERVASLLLGDTILLGVKATVILLVRHFVHLCLLLLGKSHRCLLSHLDVDLHDVEGQFVLAVLADIVAVLAVTVANAKVPKILNLCEVLDNEEVVLVSLRYSV